MNRRPSLSTWLIGHATRRANLLAVLATAAVLWSQGSLMWMLRGLDPHIMTLQLAGSAARFWGILQAWGVSGLATFRAHFGPDLPNALIYGLWGALVVGSSLFSDWRYAARWRLAAVMPAAAVLDLLENALELHLLTLAPTDLAQAAQQGLGQGLVWAATAASGAKWGLVAGFLAVLLRRVLVLSGPWLELRVPPLLLVMGCALAMAGLTPAGPWGSPAGAPAAGGTGPALWPWLAGAAALAGLGLVLAAVVGFKRQRTTVNPLHPERTGTLVTEGIYRFSRNPMYLGMLLWLAAWALWLRHPAAWLGVVFAAAWLRRYQVLPEERLMADRFGPAYRLYCEKVRRWL